jgi:hypothetical protein
MSMTVKIEWVKDKYLYIVPLMFESKTYKLMSPATYYEQTLRSTLKAWMAQGVR